MTDTSTLPPPANLALVSQLVDVDAIESRALAAPGGTWTAFPGQLHIPWSGPDDEEPIGTWGHGRYLTTMVNEWHDRPDLPPEAWAFLASARDDVLALTSLVRWLSEALAAAITRPVGDGEMQA
jgi:hypothetical protein